MTVTLNMTNATANTTNIAIKIRNANFELNAANPLAVNGTFAFTYMSITSRSVNFTVTDQASFNGSITLPLKSSGGGTPSIEVDNLSADTVTLTWPTDDGPVTQELTPGTPMAMSGFGDS